MKHPRILTFTTCLFALALPASVHAAKGNKAAKGDKGDRPGKVLRGFDTNKNHEIDGAEIEAVRKAYEADKTGPLKRFDANNDGKIDDTEIAALKFGQRKAGKGERKKNKNV